MQSKQQLIATYNKKLTEVNQMKADLEIMEQNYTYEKIYAPECYMKTEHLKKVNQENLKLQRKIDSREQTLIRLRKQIESMG